METNVEAQVSVSVADRLEKLGFKRAGADVKVMTERKRKLEIAYKNYRVVSVEKVEAFQRKLKEKTIKGKMPYNATWQELAFMPIESYEGVPPSEVLDALEKAHDHKCFDSFEVAYIRNVKDPIIFGRVFNCSDRFYVAQWDNDIKIDDLFLGPR